MTEKKKKTFSSVQEVLETYFPAHAKHQRESSQDDYAQIGRDLASELAKKFQANLRP
jgi:hypothetical protein